MHGGGVYRIFVFRLIYCSFACHGVNAMLCFNFIQHFKNDSIWDFVPKLE